MSMKKYFKKKYVLTVFSVSFLFLAVSFKNDFFEIAKQIEIFTETFKTVNQNYVDETNPGDLMNVALKNMLKELDPYTVFFNEQDVIKFKINNTGEYTGIGAMVRRKEGRVFLKEIYKSFPADKAGLKAGDEILQIGDINLKEYKEDASQLLQGIKNTGIKIKYLRQNKEYTTTIILDEIEIKAVPYFSLLSDKTGYIVLTKFTEKAASETKEAIIKLKEQGAEKLIIDLRSNPGGLLDQAVSICNLFVPKNEIIVTTKSKSKKHNNIYKTKFEPLDTSIPLAIIINEKSASASEIVSGALQDLDRAVIVGNRSFGKGLVQRPLNLSYGTQVKVTISKYYTPSGRCIQALDYSKKDEDGKAIRIEKKDFNAFKTKAGRTVYDGGGVLPDIIIEETKKNELIESLEKNDAIFDYATTLYYKNPTLNSIPNLTEEDFTNFKIFIKQNKYDLETKTALALNDFLEKAKEDKIDSKIENEYRELQVALQKIQENEFDKNKKELVKLIKEELIVRYQYKEGLYNFATQNDIEIKKASSILNNKNQYQSLLK